MVRARPEGVSGLLDRRFLLVRSEKKPGHDGRHERPHSMPDPALGPSGVRCQSGMEVRLLGTIWVRVTAWAWVRGVEVAEATRIAVRRLKWLPRVARARGGGRGGWYGYGRPRALGLPCGRWRAPGRGWDAAFEPPFGSEDEDWAGLVRLEEQLTDEPLRRGVRPPVSFCGTCVSNVCSSTADGESVQGASSRSSVGMARAASRRPPSREHDRPARMRFCGRHWL